MSTPNERLHAATERHATTKTSGLAPDPTLNLGDLGDDAELIDHAVRLATDPDAQVVAAALAHAGPDADAPLHEFISHLPAQTSLLALTDTVDTLLADERVITVHGAHLHDTLLPPPAAHASTAALAAVRLETCARLVLLKARPPWAVIGSITAACDQPHEGQERLPRLIGALLDTASTTYIPLPAREELLRCLHNLAAADMPDAAFELAAHALRTALTQPRERAIVDTAAAVDELQRLPEHDERPDAALLLNAGQALLAFANHDIGALRYAAHRANTAADTIALHRRGMHTRPWTAARRATRSAQLAFAADLTRLADELAHNSFLNTDEALVIVGNAYANARAVSPAGIEALPIVRAHIENDLARKTTMCHQLERALEADSRRPQPILPAGAALLAAALRDTRGREAGTSSGDPAPGGTDSEPHSEAKPAAGSPDHEPQDAEAARAHPRLTTLLGPRTTTELLHAARASEADLELLATVDQALASSSRLGLLDDHNPIIDEVEERLLAELQANERFTGETRTHFWRLTQLTIQFVHHTINNRSAHLRPYKQRDQAPVEKDLQQHFAQWLGSVLNDVDIEVINVAGGRADVVTTFPRGHRFVTEVKRDFDDVSRDALESKYLGQAATYQAAGLPFGGLMTLDLTPKSGVGTHLLDQLWVTNVQPDGSAVTRSVLCSVVVGNRPTPSAVRLGSQVADGSQSRTRTDANS